MSEHVRVSFAARLKNVFAPSLLTNRLCAFFAAVLLSGVASQALAQTTTATIFGTVTDPNQAAIPKATVTATDLATNFTRTVISDESGDLYDFTVTGRHLHHHRRGSRV